MISRKHIRDLKVDNIVIAEIIEPLSGQDFIVNFDGALVRVRNQSNLRLKRNQKISLRVLSLQPLEFQMVVSKPVGSSSDQKSLDKLV